MAEGPRNGRRPQEWQKVPEMAGGPRNGRRCQEGQKVRDTRYLLWQSKRAVFGNYYTHLYTHVCIESYVCMNITATTSK